MTVGQRSECPSDDTLLRWIEGRVEPEERDGILRHVGQCTACLAVAGGAAEAFEDERSEHAEAHRVWAERYELRARIGSGGMGVVYRAWDQRLEREVALKVLHSPDDPRQSDEHRLERESKLMARLRHPHVVTVHDIGRVDGRLYVAMEYVGGENLRQWLDREPRAPAEIADRLLHAGRGLLAAHEAGIVHRDFKPDNVLLDSDGRALVTDFGLAAVDPTLAYSPTGADLGSPGRDGPTRTRRGTSGIGTPGYVAPEQLEGRADLRSDVFSFCVTAWEAFQQRRPFPESSTMRRLEAIERGEFIEPAVPMPRALEGALRRGLRARPELRPSLSQLLEVLEATLRRSRSPRRRAWGIAGLVGGLAVTSALVTGGLPERRSRCDTPPDDRLARTWHNGIMDRIEATIPEHSTPQASLMWSRVASGVEAYRVSLLAAERETCRALEAGQLSKDDAFAKRLCVDGLREHLAVRLEAAARSRPLALVSLLDHQSVDRCVYGQDGELTDPLSPAQARTLHLANMRLEAQYILEEPSRENAHRLLQQAQELGSRYYQAVGYFESSRRETDPVAEYQLLTAGLEIARSIEAHALSVRIGTIIASTLGSTVGTVEEASELTRAIRRDADATRDPILRARADVTATLAEVIDAGSRGELELASVLVAEGLTKARRHAPSAVEAALNLQAALAALRGDYETAQDTQRDLVRYYEDKSPELLINARVGLADTLRQAGKSEAALAEIEPALSLHRQLFTGTPHSVGWSTAIQAAVEAGHLDTAASLEAELDWAAATRDGELPDDTVWVARARLRLARGDVASARSLIEPRVAALPSPSVSYEQDMLLALYGEVLRRQGDRTSAVPIVRDAYMSLRDAVPHSSATARSATTLGWLLAPSDPSAARELFEFALERFEGTPEGGWAAFALATLSARSENSEDVRREVRRARDRLKTREAAFIYELGQIDDWLSRHS